MSFLKLSLYCHHTLFLKLIMLIIRKVRTGSSFLINFNIFNSYLNKQQILYYHYPSINHESIKSWTSITNKNRLFLLSTCDFNIILITISVYLRINLLSLHTYLVGWNILQCIWTSRFLGKCCGVCFIQCCESKIKALGGLLTLQPLLFRYSAMHFRNPKLINNVINYHLTHFWCHFI